MKRSRLIEIARDGINQNTREAREVDEILKEIVNEEIDDEDVKEILDIVTETLTRNIRK